MTGGARQAALVAAPLWCAVAWSCALDEAAGVCQLGGTAAQFFPTDGATDIPTDAVVRVLLPSREAARSDLRLVREPQRVLVGAKSTSTPTDFGVVIELAPDLPLATQSTFSIELVASDQGVPTAVSRFSTAEQQTPPGPPVVRLDDEVAVTSITRDIRACCAASGCRDGSAVSVARPPQDAFVPQLLMVELERLREGECAPELRPAGAIPVLFDSEAATRLVAESDLPLAGCFRLTVRDQQGGVTEPSAEAVCSPGFVWDPGPIAPDCESGRGCHAATTTPHPSSIAFWVLFCWLALRVRRKAVNSTL